MKVKKKISTVKLHEQSSNFTKKFTLKRSQKKKKKKQKKEMLV